jgi:EAL domain-containing protein (putative c-di-GMP-specific phosphodiesterase class I)
VSKRRVLAHEVLMRSREPMLPTPAAVLDAAERLDRIHEVGRKVRALAAGVLEHMPHNTWMFVNLHPVDLTDPELADPRSPLGKNAQRVVLEITERASLEDIKDASARASILRYMGYRFAIDDLGAGHAGLGGFSRLEPEFVKLDMSLVRNVHAVEPRQRLVKALCSLCRDLDATVIAEGIEVLEECNALRKLGCDLMQGHLFAAPAVRAPSISWRIA